MYVTCEINFSFLNQSILLLRKCVTYIVHWIGVIDTSQIRMYVKYLLLPMHLRKLRSGLVNARKTSLKCNECIADGQSPPSFLVYSFSKCSHSFFKHIYYKSS
jgi:hypothetical protein